MKYLLEYLQVPANALVYLLCVMPIDCKNFSLFLLLKFIVFVSLCIQTLTFFLHIAITASPQDVTNAVGTKVNLTCSASGVDNIMYEWMRQRSMISSGAAGRSTNTLVINDIQPGDSGTYRCIASSGDVSVNSEYATVTVLCKLFYSWLPYL